MPPAATMRAAVYDRYGPPEVVRVEDVPRPRPGPGEVLVRVRACEVSSGDARLRAARFPPLFQVQARLMFGVTRPRNRVLGSAFAGEVVETGAGADGFRSGDRVFGSRLFGVHAEFVCLKAAAVLVAMPKGLDFVQAAAIPFGGLAALHFLRKAGVERAQRVLVHGASGAVGVSAVQLARHFGAEVTAVCSAANAGLVRSLGAARVIDYGSEDFAAGDARYDIILDTVGATSFAQARRVLAPGGAHAFLVTGLAEVLQSALPHADGQRVLAGVAEERAEDLALLAGLAAEGELVPVIDSCAPLERAAEAHRRVDSGRKRGSVVLTPGRAD